MVVDKKRGDRKTLKRLYSVVCGSKIGYGCQLNSTASPGTLKKYSILYRIIINLGTFRTSPVESMHAEACDPTMELRK